MAERLCVQNQDIQQMKDMQWKVFVIENDDFNAHVYPVSKLTICKFKLDDCFSNFQKDSALQKHKTCQTKATCIVDFILFFIN